MPRTPATPAQPGDVSHNPAKKSPRRSNSSKTPNKTTVPELIDDEALVDDFPALQRLRPFTHRYIGRLTAALVDLQSFYDRIDRGDTSWSGADAQRLADIRRLSNSLHPGGKE